MGLRPSTKVVVVRDWIKIALSDRPREADVNLAHGRHLSTVARIAELGKFTLENAFNLSSPFSHTRRPVSWSLRSPQKHCGIYVQNATWP
jgi:hypothetical protein